MENEVIALDDDECGVFPTPAYSKAADECAKEIILYSTAGAALDLALQRWA
jgi:hypothetical protein